MENEIWKAIAELYFLLEQPELPEEEFQLYFERNPCVFDILGFDCHAAFDIKSGNKLPFDRERKFSPMPDFICGKRETEEAVVFEIKRPSETKAITTRADGNRAKLRASIDRYVSQTCEYVKSIRGNHEARAAVSHALKMPRIRSTSGFLLCGISEDSEAPVVAELISEREPRLQFMYYDKLFEKLCDTYARSQIKYTKIGKKHEGIAGVHLTVLASISKIQKHNPAYLIDIGDSEKNRISILISDFVYVRLVDAHGRHQEIKLDIEFGKPQLFQIEFSNDQTIGFLSVVHNNNEVFHMQRQDGYELRVNLEKFTIGANHDGILGVCAIMGTACLRYKVLGIKERLDFLGHLVDQSEAGAGLEYNGSQYMRRNSGGRLVQETTGARPILRESLHYDRLKH